MQTSETMQLSDIRRAAGSLKDVRVLLRASLNVPVVEGVVKDDFRISRTMQTVEFLRKQGARVLIAGHIGRDPEASLAPVFSFLKESLPLTFVPDLKTAAMELKSSEIVLLENLRRFPGETENDSAFAAALASLADIYVNDAFSDSHREHASIVRVPKLIPSYAGISLLQEVEHLAPAFNPPHPSLFVLGGAKFETKAPLIRKFLDAYDAVFVGGALAHDLFKAKGWNIGKSLSSEMTIAAEDILSHPHLILPPDVIVETPDGVRLTKAAQAVLDDEIIFDAGPKTVEMILARARDAKFILWNGPLGNYERGYNEQTEKLAAGFADLPAATVVGGGDTVAAIAALSVTDKYNFISTGGGAMLEFLQNGTIAGIEALKK